MKTKKVLAAFLSAAMVLTSMAVPVFADGENAGGGNAGGSAGGSTPVTTPANQETTTTTPATTGIKISGGNTLYASFSKALENTTVTEDKVVTYEVYGKVVLPSGGIKLGKEGITTINFIKGSDDAELSLEGKGLNLVGFDHATSIEKINYTGLKLSRLNGAWVGDAAHLNQFFTTTIRTNSNGVVTYKDCTFPNGSGSNTYGKTVYTDCTFSNDNSDTKYNLWIRGGETEINGGTMTGAAGIKLYTDDSTKVFGDTKINGVKFENITKKPAIVATQQGNIDITDSTISNCNYGLIANESNNGAELANITVDGAAPNYVASVGGNKYTEDNYARVVAIAQIGDQYYSSLKTAIEAVSGAATEVKLLNNTTESITIPKGKNITLDLNGYTLRNVEGKHTIENYGTLTITDSSTAKTGKVDNVSNTKAALINYEGATATLNGGTFDRSKEAGSKELNSETNKYDYKTGGNTYYTIRNYGAMTINEGVVANNNGVFTSLLSNGYYSPYKIVKNSENGKETKVPYFDGNKKADGTTAVTEPDPNRSLTINGGTFTGGKYIVKNDDYGKVIIKGGTFKKADQAPLLNWCDAEVTDGTFEKGSVGLAVYNGYSSKETGTGNLKISGGNFDGKILVADLTETEKATTSISGGTFSEDVSEYCVDGYVASKNSDGKYSVLVQNKRRDDNRNTDKITPVYKNPTYTKDIFGVEHKSHNAYINGYADGTVKPDGNITREELATILYRVSNDASAVVASGDKFNDVSADRWSANAIEFMASKKVVNGYEDGSFKPENNLTRGEFAAMIARFANLTDTAASRTFSDVDSSYWGFKNIMALNKAGYINGYEDGTFRPEANVTRAEVMTVINKIIGRSADASYVKSLDNNKFSDLDKNAWYYVDVMEATTDHNYTLNKSGVETEWSK